MNKPMIVWLNGPFGVGKTTVAALLVQSLHGALFIDPEKLGHAVWAQLPPTLRREEFELEPVWRTLTRQLVGDIARLYGRPLVVAMTIARLRVYDEIIGGLRHGGFDVRHVTLMASPATIRERLRSRMRHRGERPDKWGELSWEGLQVDRCLASLLDERFAIHVDAEAPDPSSVAEDVLDAIAAGSAAETHPT